MRVAFVYGSIIALYGYAGWIVQRGLQSGSAVTGPGETMGS